MLARVTIALSLAALAGVGAAGSALSSTASPTGSTESTGSTGSTESTGSTGSTESTGSTGSTGSTAGAYRAPLPQPVHVLRGFDPPATPYGPGHLGVDLRAAPGEVVRAASAGLVQFAGQVAGRGVVVIAHADGIRTEYEPVAPLVRTGVRVGAGAVIGTLHGRHAGCAEPCVHWGARRGATYLDPLGLLRPLGPVVLLPWGRAP